MKSLTLTAKAIATELGEFTAIAAAYSTDRAGDRIVPGAFKATIEKWQSSGKAVPLHWDHEGDPASIIGSVDPSSMRETDVGLEVSGRLDLDNSEKAREAWRAMRTDSMSLSFGYVVNRQAKAEDGINELQEIDLFEVSVVPAPANPDTRFLSLKSIEARIDTLTIDEISDIHDLLGKRIAQMRAEEMPPPAEEVEDESDEADEASRQAFDPEAIRIDIERIDALT